MCATAVGLGGCFTETSSFISRTEGQFSAGFLLDLKRFYIAGLVGQIISLLAFVSDYITIGIRMYLD